MLFQNLLRKSWGKKGNDAQTAIKGIESDLKKFISIICIYSEFCRAR